MLTKKWTFEYSVTSMGNDGGNDLINEMQISSASIDPFVGSRAHLLRSKVIYISNKNNY